MIKKHHIPYLLLLLLLLYCMFQYHSGAIAQKRYNANITSLTDSVTYYKNYAGTETASRKVMQVTNDEMKSLILAKDKKLAILAKEYYKITSINRFSARAGFDTIGVRFSTPILTQLTADSCNLNHGFEKSGTKVSEWYRLGYRVTNDSIIINPFETWTETTVITGFKRKWLLGEQTLVTDITNSNPYIKITGITSAKVIVPEPWYKKWYLWLAGGILGGVLLSN